jgi:solute carrier family 26 (sodium-independent sulfate anion transporter), member 11
VITSDMVKHFTGALAAAVIVLILEHVAVAKSFGRINNYTVNPSQEMIAIGVANVLGPFLGGYPVTGAFSRTAISSKAGSRTPAVGIVVALVVLLAIYVLPPLFYYIPNAALAAVIIHAVGDLITPPNTVYKFWRISPIEVVIFFVGVFVTVFSNIENGIYSTVALSVAILLIRFLKAKGSFLGKVRMHSVYDGNVIGDDHKEVLARYEMLRSCSSLDTVPQASSVGAATPPHLTPIPTRNVFLPLGHTDGSNPLIAAESPYPGIFIYRFSEGFAFPSAAHTLDNLVTHIVACTRRTTTPSTSLRKGDRPWNDPVSDSHIAGIGGNALPALKAVILDFSAVDNVDLTAAQQLGDARAALDRHAAPRRVDWHLACVRSRWAKRALAAAGFGTPTKERKYRPVYGVAEIAEHLAGVDVADERGLQTPANDEEAAVPPEEGEEKRTAVAGDEEKKAESSLSVPRRGEVRTVAIHGMNRPLFHVDLTCALQSAVANLEEEEQFEVTASQLR